MECSLFARDSFTGFMYINSFALCDSSLKQVVFWFQFTYEETETQTFGNFSQDTDTVRPSQDLNTTNLIPEAMFFQKSNCKHFTAGKTDRQQESTQILSEQLREHQYSGKKQSMSRGQKCSPAEFQPYPQPPG